MAKVDEAFEVRYKKGKENFEVLVDFDSLAEFRKKPDETSVYDVLADYKIFKDQKKGDIASENLLKEVFGSKSEEDILKEILINGECQIPTAFLNKLRDEKKVQVINYIAENAINPATKSKYTTSMIESSINKIRYNFDPHKDYVFQAEEVLKLLRKEMPISLDKIILEIVVPSQYAGSFYGPFRKFGKITKEYYDNEGNLRMHIEIMESLQDRVIDFIKKNSNNESEYHIRND